MANSPTRDSSCSVASVGGDPLGGYLYLPRSRVQHTEAELYRWSRMLNASRSIAIIVSGSRVRLRFQFAQRTEHEKVKEQLEEHHLGSADLVVGEDEVEETARQGLGVSRELRWVTTHSIPCRTWAGAHLVYGGGHGDLGGRKQRKARVWRLAGKREG